MMTHKYRRALVHMTTADLQGRCWLSFPTLVYAWLCVWRYGDAEWAEDVFWEVA